ncbi:hypothetical protein RJ640_001012 [Escallonia rubra]|uniref:Uncharacterized protein n=1 Tax=Escallonia rubra TaxID=112253 RepID=A0AA88R9X1_9ASTE|nr:hypothetical protein RJ640_001012 [Escallonia rubra]
MEGTNNGFCHDILIGTKLKGTKLKAPDADDAKEDLLEKEGWLNLSAYIVSKAALNAYSRILAKKFTAFRVNAVSPGFCKTDLSHNNGQFTAEEGARGPVRMALIPADGPSGKFFYQMEESAL